MKKRSHQLVLTIVTDKPCTGRVALREVKDNVYGLHYCTQFEDGEPGEFRIKSVRTLSRRAR